jgi:multiple sugar transport system permease protein
VYLQDEKLYTVSLGLAQLQGKFVTQWNQVMAASTVTVIPILLVFLFAQKYFVEGVSITGIK